MGSGKSYCGQRLAQSLKLPFVDLDDYLERQAGRSISTIFAESGEAHFRLLEQTALREVGQQKDTVIATGGGTPCFFDNLDWMNQQGITIYLQASVDLLLKRLETEITHRPLLQGKTKAELRTFIHKKLAERSSFYERASVILRQETEGEDCAMHLARELIRVIGH